LFSRRCLSVYLLFFCSTLFAVAFSSTRRIIAYVKFCQRKDILAFCADFCYNFVRHFRSPKRDCLRPFTGPIPVRGLFILTH
jgi:hypothetical protein